MKKTRPPMKIVMYSSSSDYESEPNMEIKNESGLANSKSKQPANDYSYEYEYSYSSDENLPQIRSSPQRTKAFPNTRKNFVPPRRNIKPVTPPPKPLKIEQSSDSSVQNEDTEINRLNSKSTDQLSSEIDPSKTTQQEKEISEGLNESIAIDITSSINETPIENDNNIESQSDNVEPIDDNNDSDDQRDDDTKYYNSYFCSKLKMKSPNDFSFSQKSSSLFYAKSKGILSSHVYISSNENFNIKEKQYEYVMKISHNRSQYELRRADDKTNILVMMFDNDYGKEYGPRKIIMEWPQKHLKYFSRIPRKTESGNWELNFNGKYVIASQKNAIILDDNSKPIIMIRKVQKTILQIEVIHNMDPIDLFALGIASFICPF